MKKISLFAFVLLVGMTSCKKTTTVADTSKIVDVTLASNTAYVYTLGTTQQNISITSQASHAQMSAITNVPVSPATYQYIPDSNYVGTDNVTIVVLNDPHGNCQGHPGNCKNHPGGCKNNPSPSDAIKTTYTFRFTIGNTVKN